MVYLNRLRERRERRLLTIEELAERAGVNRNTIARAERLEIEPRFTTIRKIAAALDVMPTDLTTNQPRARRRVPTAQPKA